MDVDVVGVFTVVRSGITYRAVVQRSFSKLLHPKLFQALSTYASELAASLTEEVFVEEYSKSEQRFPVGAVSTGDEDEELMRQLGLPTAFGGSKDKAMEEVIVESIIPSDAADLIADDDRDCVEEVPETGLANSSELSEFRRNHLYYVHLRAWHELYGDFMHPDQRSQTESQLACHGKGSYSNLLEAIVADVLKTSKLELSSDEGQDWCVLWDQLGEIVERIGVERFCENQNEEMEKWYDDAVREASAAAVGKKAGSSEICNQDDGIPENGNQEVLETGPPTDSKNDGQSGNLSQNGNFSEEMAEKLTKAFSTEKKRVTFSNSEKILSSRNSKPGFDDTTLIHEAELAIYDSKPDLSGQNGEIPEMYDSGPIEASEPEKPRIQNPETDQNSEIYDSGPSTSTPLAGKGENELTVSTRVTAVRHTLGSLGFSLGEAGTELGQVEEIGFSYSRKRKKRNRQRRVHLGAKQVRIGEESVEFEPEKTSFEQTGSVLEPQSAGAKDFRKNQNKFDDFASFLFSQSQEELSKCLRARENIDLSYPAKRKYYMQRYHFWSKFDDGIWMDEEGWYSVTPEPIAQHIAEQVCCNPRTNTGMVVMDAFCGVGGNAIQFARAGAHVVACDLDPAKLICAKHNAELYKVADRITFILGDYRSVTASLRPGAVDVVFLSPPWGGPEYSQESTYDLESMLQPEPASIMIERVRALTPDIVLFLPRNSSVLQITELAGANGGCVTLEQNFLNDRYKAVTAYYGSLGVNGQFKDE